MKKIHKHLQLYAPIYIVPIIIVFFALLTFVIKLIDHYAIILKK